MLRAIPGLPMRVLGPSSTKFSSLLWAFCLLWFSPVSPSQSSHDGRVANDEPATGEVEVQVQDVNGEPFFEGATVSLSAVKTKWAVKSDVNGIAHFSNVQAREYLAEISFPGYRSVQQQVVISTTQRTQNFVVSMIPNNMGTDRDGTVSPKAVKETEKALQALQANKLDEAEQHLALSFAVDASFPDSNYLMGIILLRRKEPARAGAYLQKTLSLSPNHAPALLALGQAQYLGNDYAGANKSLVRFLREQPSSAQATAAQKYIDAIRAHEAKRTDDSALSFHLISTNPEGGDGPLKSPSPSGGAKDAELSALARSGALPAEITPITETNWAPPDIDERRIEVDDGAACRLDEILDSTSTRVKELVENVDRFTATEELDQFNLSPMGLETGHENRKFNYLVEIRQHDTGDLNVEEYRNGSMATNIFPSGIATIGLPTLALVFHPNTQDRYEFSCEGLGSWRGRAAWQVHFRQRSDRGSVTLLYHIGSHVVAVGLKGRAWIDPENHQIMAMESDIVHPYAEIKLLRDHQLIEYGPVGFRGNSVTLWLPKSADWYSAFGGRRFHRRHSFHDFMLFAVDDKQKISAPKYSEAN